MDRLSIISDSIGRAEDVSRKLTGVFDTQSFVRDRLSQAPPTKHAIVDIDLEDSSYLADLGFGWIFGRNAERPFSSSSTAFVFRPCKLSPSGRPTSWSVRSIARGCLQRFLAISVPWPAILRFFQLNGISAGIAALQSIFASAVSGTPVDLNMVQSAGETVVAQIDAEGLVRWIDTVRQHHSLTYQHCLLVTGVAVAFGRHLGFSSEDKQKLAFAGLLHDIGKAGVPVAILEKPEPTRGGRGCRDAAASCIGL